MEQPQIEAVDLASRPSEASGELRTTMDEPVDVMDECALRLERLDALLMVLRESFARVSSDTWVSMLANFGFDYERVEVVALEQGARFHFDTGLRAPQSAVRELNKLIMVGNSTLRLRGFDPLPATGGPITFTYLLNDEMLGLGADEETWEALLLCDEDDDEQPERGVKLLQTSLILASKTICTFTSRFNAVIYGDVCALDARCL